MKRVVIFIAAITLMLALPAPSLAASAKSNPNILFVLIDDLGYGDLGCTGAELANTPNLDSFAKNSHVFSSAYAPSPQCSPTRGAILTGQYPARLHITTWIGGAKTSQYKGLNLPSQRTSLRDGVYTMAQYLKDAGYETAQIGKWHLGHDAKEPSRVGFDHTIAFTKGAGPGKGKEWFGPYPKIPDLTGPPEEYITERLTTETIRFMTKKRDKPFFVMLQHFDVHAPLVAPEADVKRYLDQGRPEKGKLSATYLAMVEQVDTSFGRLVNALKESGQYDNTVIVFFSDNGANTWDGDNGPFRGGKKDFYEGGIRVPLLMHVPGTEVPDERHDVPINGIDFFPTFVELTGGKINNANTTLDGVSIMPILRGSGTLERDCIFWHHPALSRTYRDIPPQGAVRQGKWKFIDYYGSIQEDELYNLEEDPGEKNNLADKHPEKVKELRQKLAEHLKAVDAQMVEEIVTSP
jgi:arylsulfatase A-like enzyme